MKHPLLSDNTPSNLLFQVQLPENGELVWKTCSKSAYDAFKTVEGCKVRMLAPLPDHVDISRRLNYIPEFDTPTTTLEALMWLERQGDPLVQTFSAAQAAAATRYLSPLVTWVFEPLNNPDPRVKDK